MCRALSRAGIGIAFLSIGCSSTIEVRRPLSSSALAEINDAVEGRPATVMLEGEGSPQAEGAPELACERAAGQGFKESGEGCLLTAECECGLTCKDGQCVGTSLKKKPHRPQLPDARDVK